MFIAALFTTAKIQKWSKYPMIAERKNSGTYIHTYYICTIKYYSEIRKGEILFFSTTCIELEGVILSKISQRG